MTLPRRLFLLVIDRWFGLRIPVHLFSHSLLLVKNEIRDYSYANKLTGILKPIATFFLHQIPSVHSWCGLFDFIFWCYDAKAPDLLVMCELFFFFCFWLSTEFVCQYLVHEKMMFE